MNWQTREIIKEAKETINDEGVFSYDQVTKLLRILDLIEKAIDKESDCNKPNITM